VVAVSITSSLTKDGCMIIAVHFQLALSADLKADMSSVHHSPSSGMTP
jgi:hypothetical protein